MTGQDAFSQCHPGVCLLYFGLVLTLSMFLLHPVCLVISLFSALCCRLRLGGGEGLRGQAAYLLPMMALAALINAAFNHRGVTVLTWLPGGNPLTLESILYGVAAGLMLAAVMLWFGCLSAVMTADKLIFLLGRAAPALSLLLSMSLGLLPRLRRRFRAVREANRSTVSQGRPFQRLRGALTALSAVLTWSLESAIHTADSMGSRGYGLPGRSSFAIYRFHRRDGALLAWLVLCGGLVLLGWGGGGFSFRYFPSIKASGFTASSVCLFGAYLALCLTPAAMGVWEDFVWQARREGVGG